MRAFVWSFMVVAAFVLCRQGSGSSDCHDPEVKFTVRKLRTYCAACHAIGKIKFIQSESDDEVWHYLFNFYAPNSGKLWADRITDVLDWPSDEAPPPDQMMSPPNNDWMPKGVKRLQLADDWVDGKSTRRILLETLRRWRP